MELAEPRCLLVEGSIGGQVEEQRPDLRAQEVVGARGAERGEARRVLGSEEVEYDVRVGEPADDVPIRGRKATHDRREHRCTSAPLHLGQGLVAGTRRPERLGTPVLFEISVRLLDQRQCQGLRLVGRVGPRDDAVAAQHDPVELGLGGDEVAEPQAEVEPGPLPVEPAEPALERRLDVLAAVRRGREGDQGVRMQVVDMGEGKKSVQRRVDRRDRAARSEAGVVEQTDHPVLVVAASVDAFQAAQPLEVDERETSRRQRAEVAAGALDGENVARLARDRILELDLHGRVAAAEVGDARI